MPFAAWLVAAAGPIVIQALIAVGFGMVTVVGADTAVTAFLQIVTDNVSALPSDLISLMALGGFFQALSFVGSAIVGRVALQGWGALKKLVLK